MINFRRVSFVCQYETGGASCRRFHAAVSHVINGTRYVAEETKAKVLRAMKELDYRPNNVARSLRSQKSSIIGLIVPLSASYTANFFFMSIAQGIEEVLKEAGYNLILSNSKERLADELERIRSSATVYRGADHRLRPDHERVR